MVITVALGSYAGVEGNKSWIKDGPDIGYFQNTGLFVYKIKKKRKQITDGTSSTIAIGEVMGEDTDSGSNMWTDAYRDGSCMRNTVNPINTRVGNVPDPNSSAVGTLSDCKYASGSPLSPCWNGAFGSNHKGGANFVYADGHTVYISENIDLATYRAASTIAGGEALSAP